MTTTTTTANANELDLSAGSYVKGIPLSETTFLAATWSDSCGPSPATRTSSSRAASAVATSPESRRSAPFTSSFSARWRATRSNVPRYTRYIEQLVRGEAPGVLPPIDLWTAQALDVVTVGTTYILVPNGEHLLAIDGETQLAAHMRSDGRTPSIPKPATSTRSSPLPPFCTTVSLPASPASTSTT